MALEVQLVSPEKILFTGEARSVLARTIGGGDIAFLTGHAPFIGALDIHPVVVHLEDGDDVVVAVHGGFVEVSGQPRHDPLGRRRAARADRREPGRGRPGAGPRRRCGPIADDAEAKAALARATARVAVATGKAAAGH